MTKFLKLVAMGYWDTFLQSDSTKLGDKFGVSDHGKPSHVNPSFRLLLQARGGIFSDHVTLFFRSHDHNRTASDSNFQQQFYHSTGFDSMMKEQLRDELEEQH